MINFDADRRVWEQVYEILRERIEEGAYKERMPIPSLIHLQQELGVSLGTVRKVVKVLAEEGFLNPISGRGTYVLPRERWPSAE
ncbi:GntR family transcriptional regulator [Sphaerisporangium sp. TRM90804]|uniref:GntR family transcriptional regulator n=1 Tax=Sphaerisporangium sp. TRM90804 TaxID=3031113 RepID=UPI00244AE5DA|nr:GntR family transcriptional regulator [Sphaerisporangium sp. TRM90804]MDH2424701.1 GntR family transcriptional regulator [Sphaerisporangium sp. TRM90804]